MAEQDPKAYAAETLGIPVENVWGTSVDGDGNTIAVTGSGNKHQIAPDGTVTTLVGPGNELADLMANPVEPPEADPIVRAEPEDLKPLEEGAPTSAEALAAAVGKPLDEKGYVVPDGQEALAPIDDSATPVADGDPVPVTDGATPVADATPDHFEVYKGEDKKFYFARVSGGNNKRVDVSAPHVRRKDAVTEAEREAGGLEVRIV
jgi:hypothetical protein